LPLYNWILENSANENIILMGDSAGGGFALALAQLLLEKNLPQPQKIILLSPWLDITMKNPAAHALERNDSMVRFYGVIARGRADAGDTDFDHYMLSPINGNIN